MTAPVEPTAPPELKPFPAKGDSNYNRKAFDWGTAWPAFVTWLISAIAGAWNNARSAWEAVGVASDYTIAAQQAAAAASASAQNAAVVSGADQWVAGNYTLGDPVWSPISLLTYRRVTPGTTASAVDPANDPAGWRLTGSPHSLPQKDITTALDPDTSLPHLLSVGMHYIILHPLAVCSMPAGAVAQELLRVTNRSGATTPKLLRNGDLFDGDADDLELDSLTADKTFTKTATRGWL